MTDLTALTIAQARDALRKRASAPPKSREAHLGAMEKARALNAYVLETPDIARAMAKESDRRIAAGKAGPLEGIPIGVKDLFCTKDVRTHRELAHPRQFHPGL